MGLLAYRYRLRVLIAATVAAGVIAFLIAGVGGCMTVFNNAYIGELIGVIKRRGRGTPTVIAASCASGAVFGAVVVVALATLARLRHLIFDAITANVTGLAAAMGWIGLERVGNGLKRFLSLALHFWPWLMLGQSIAGIVVVSLIGWWALSRV
ncbi:MAG: cobalt ABC transporter ATP-binding protein, partial [Mycobacterium sp.]|nr:cobalt ABC transporter ATP-binding protein [Mycobacterium sp.]